MSPHLRGSKIVEAFIPVGSPSSAGTPSASSSTTSLLNFLQQDPRAADALNKLQSAINTASSSPTAANAIANAKNMAATAVANLATTASTDMATSAVTNMANVAKNVVTTAASQQTYGSTSQVYAIAAPSLLQLLDVNVDNSISILRKFTLGTLNEDDSKFVNNAVVMTDVLGTPILDDDGNTLRRATQEVENSFVYYDTLNDCIKIHMSTLFDYFNHFMPSNAADLTANIHAQAIRTLIDTSHRLTINDADGDDSVVSNFSTYMFHGTLDLLKKTVMMKYTGNDIDVTKAFIDNQLRPLAVLSKNTGIPMKAVDMPMMNEIYYKSHAPSTVQTFLNEAVSLGAFEMFNYFLYIDSLNAFKPRLGGNDVKGACSNYYCMRMVYASNYVNQYYFWQTLIALLGAVGRQSHLEVERSYSIDPQTGIRLQLQTDVGIVMQRIENIFRRMEEGETLTTQFFKSAAEKHKEIDMKQAQLATMNSEFGNNKIRLNVAMEKSKISNEKMNATRATMMAWGLLVFLYIVGVIVFFNVAIPGYDANAKVMPIVCLCGVVALTVLIREIFIIYSKKNS